MTKPERSSSQGDTMTPYCRVSTVNHPVLTPIAGFPTQKRWRAKR